MCWCNQYIGSDSTKVRKGTVEVVEIKKGILSWAEMFINDADVIDKQ